MEIQDLNIKTVTLIDKEKKESIYLSNWDGITTNINTGRQFIQSRSLFDAVLKSCENEYFVKISEDLKTGEYINIHTGEKEELWGIE